MLIILEMYNIIIRDVYTYGCTNRYVDVGAEDISMVFSYESFTLTPLYRHGSTSEPYWVAHYYRANGVMAPELSQHYHFSGQSPDFVVVVVVCAVIANTRGYHKVINYGELMRWINNNSN